MSKVATFNGASDGFTVTGPERYSSGLWLEEGTTNLLLNPSFETNLTSWTAEANITATRDTSEFEYGAASVKLVKNASGSANAGFRQDVTTSIGQVYTFAVSVKGTATAMNLVVTSVGNTVASALTNSFARKQYTFTAALVSSRCALQTGTGSSGEIVWGDGAQVENKPYATSYVDTTRAASSASISPSGILSPSSGALAFRITPTIETGVEEIWGECGVKGSGTDHVRWGRDSSKHPFVEWSANNASYQRLTGSETLNALTAYDLYLGHSATTISLAVDAGTLQTGTRDAISDSWGAGDLTLKATTGGVVYNQFATFNRPLSASEIKTLDRRNSWSRTMFGNPYRNFQLRPY